MKTLIYFDESAFNNKKESFEDAATELQKLVAAYGEMNLPKLEKDEFHELLYNTEAIVFKKMTNGKPLELAGFPVHAHKAMEMLHKPAGYDKLKQLAETLRQEIRHNGGVLFAISDNTNKAKNMFEINQTGELKIKDDYLKRIEDEFKIYAVSDRAIKMNDFAKEVLKLINEREIIKGADTRDGIGGFMETLFVYQETTAGAYLRINHAGIARYNGDGY